MLMQSKYIFNNWVQVQNIVVRVYTYLIYILFTIQFYAL